MVAWSSKDVSHHVGVLVSHVRRCTVPPFDAMIAGMKPLRTPAALALLAALGACAPIPADYADRSLTLGLTVRSRDRGISLSVHDFGLDGAPELLFQGEDDVER